MTKPTFECPKCGEKIEVEDEMLFDEFECPKCGYKREKPETEMSFDKTDGKLKIISETVTDFDLELRALEKAIGDEEKSINNAKKQIDKIKKGIENSEDRIELLKSRQKQIKELRE